MLFCSLGLSVSIPRISCSSCCDVTSGPCQLLPLSPRHHSFLKRSSAGRSSGILFVVCAFGATKPIRLKGSGVSCPKPVCCQAPWDGMPQARSVSRNWPGMFEGRSPNLPWSAGDRHRERVDSYDDDVFLELAPCEGSNERGMLLHVVSV